MSLRISALPSADDLAHQEQRLRKQRQAQELSEMEGNQGAGTGAGAISPQQAAQVELAAKLVGECERLPQPGAGYVSARDLRKALSGVGTLAARRALAAQKRAGAEKRPLVEAATLPEAIQIPFEPIAKMDSPWLVMMASDSDGPTARSISNGLPSGPQLLDNLVTEESESASCVMAVRIDVESEGRSKSSAAPAGLPVLIDGELVPSLVKRIRITPMQDAPRVRVAHFM